MKKLLALVLALVMTLSLCVTSNAAFTDAADIEHTEAVEVLTALGVINGRTDGSFDPKGTVTRAEMAKMITIVSLGDVGAEAFVGATTNLTDVNGHWAEAYIKYCYSQGIIAGKGNNLFDPNANVTAVEAAKMLLVAIGYNAAVQEYTGSQWQINVTRDAQLSKFYEMLTVNANADLTRDQAAQMIYNAIDAALIEKTSVIDRVDGSISDSYHANPSKSLLTETFECRTTKGLMTGFSYDSDKSKWTYNFADGSSTKYNVAVTFDGNIKSTTDYTGFYQQKVKLLWTVDKEGNEVLFGIYGYDTKVVAEGTLGSFDFTDAADQLVKVGDVEVKLEKGKTNFTHYFEFNAASNSDSSYVPGTNFKVTDKVVGKDIYNAVVLDQDGNGRADTVIVYPVTVAKVTYVGTTNIGTNAGSTYASMKKEDIKVYDGIAKDDYVIITAKANSTTEDVELAKAEMIEGKVTKLNGVKAMINDTYYKVVGRDVTSGSTSLVVELGNTYKAALVNGYFCLDQLVAASVSADDYALVTAAEVVSSGLNSHPQAKLLFTDGNTKLVELATKDENDADINYDTNSDEKNDFVGKLVTFETDSDDVYTLTERTTTTTSSSADFCGFKQAATGTFTPATGSKGAKLSLGNIDDNAVIFYYNSTKDSYKTITGAELKKVTSALTVDVQYGVKNDSTGVVSVQLAYVKGATTVSEGSYNYAYLLAAPVATKDADKKNVYELSVWTKDGEALLTTKAGSAATSAAASMSKGTAFTYKMDGELVNSINPTDSGYLTAPVVGAVTAWDGEYLTVESGTVTSGVVTTVTKTETMLVDEKTVVLYVDRDKCAGVEGGEIALATETASNQNYANVAYVKSETTTDGDYTVKLLVVEVANNWYNVSMN